MTATKSERLDEKLQIAIVTILSIGVCALMYYFHAVRGTGVVVTHFLCIPILASLCWSSINSKSKQVG